ncbi:hypothetical protein [Acuticoccus sp.]|uniref:hypothetical protein n=1 Tax=Acuticoccus sp. TaxID=1904378 RepID=UPI003B51B597
MAEEIERVVKSATSAADSEAALAPIEEEAARARAALEGRSTPRSLAPTRM